MLTDPQTVSIAGTEHSMARKAIPGFPGKGDILSSSNYATADLTERLHVVQYRPRNGHRYVEVFLAKRVSEPDGLTANNRNIHGTWNSVGLTLVFDEHRSEISSLADLRTALSSHVSPVLLNRLIGGES
jgi:hypothetical protein